MDEMMDVLGNIVELDVLPMKYKADIRMDMPQDEDECRVYSLQTTLKLLDMLNDSPANLLLIYAYLQSRFDAGRYQEMHLFLIMCYLGVGLEPPTEFQQIGQFDDLLKLLMNEVIEDFRDYLVQNADAEDDWDESE